MNNTLNAIIVSSNDNCIELKLHIEKSINNESVKLINPDKLNNLEDINFNPQSILFMDYHTFLDNSTILRQIVKHSEFLILMSSENKDAINAFKYKAFDFINYQTLTLNEVTKVLLRINNAISESNYQQKIDEIYSNINYNKKVKIKTKTGIEFILPKDILFIETDNYCSINLISGQSVKTTLSISKIILLLPDKHFFRFSRSIIINSNYILCVDEINNLVKVGYNGLKKQFEIPEQRLKDSELSIAN